MTAPVLGQIKGGGDLLIDVDRLIATRALLTANSGAGKSWALRRLLEQTSGRAHDAIEQAHRALGNNMEWCARVEICVVHARACPYWRIGKKHAPCNCGALELGTKRDAALAAWEAKRGS